MQSPLSKEQVLDWAKEQARFHSEQATFYEQMVVGLERDQPRMLRFKREEGQAHDFDPNRTLTADELEKSVSAKTGRVADFARRLNVPEQTVRNLLEPASRVYMADRGWLKLRS